MSASPAPGLDRGSGTVKTPARTPPPASVTKVTPIVCLKPDQRQWTVRARVTDKSKVRTWSNDEGEGKLFSFVIMDESKEIRVTAFNNEVDTFFSLVERGKVYLISKATIRIANKRYSTVENDYEITLNNIATILPCDDSPDIPTLQPPPASVSKVIPIACLKPDQTKWTVRARVTNKSEVRTWRNSRGEGKLFSFEIMDESKQIRVTAFNDEVDTFFSLVEQGKVFLISKATIQIANKQYSTVENDYEITLNYISTILPCDDSPDLPTLQCDFVPIAELENKDPDAVIDVIGVCRSAEEVSRITTKTGRDVSKRELNL